ncbi:apolipoprotein acyltransferase [Primorskyibacter flagellatus]|uniref:apolipoprotein acyltransferase n=1 Tax=Primorskyibacter flagellatus TaxID=1387277 RepID=UPI003A8F7BBF
MIYIIFGIIGAVIGGLIAKRRKGAAADIALYAAVYFIAFSLVGLILTLLLDRFIV